MNKKVISVIIICLVLQFIKVWWIQDFIREHGKSRVEYLVCDDSGISYERITRSSIYQTVLPIILKEKEVTVAGSNKQTLAIGTTAEYIQLEHLDMVQGSFFSDQAVQEKRNVVVLSEQMAVKLFRTTKIVGNTIRCNDALYKVVGVYKKRNHIWEKVCDDGHEIIYLPITNNLYKEIDSKQVIINGQYIDHMPNQAMMIQLGLGESTIKKYDHTYWIDEIEGVSRLPIVLLGIVCCFFVNKGVLNKKSNNERWKNTFTMVGEIGILIGINIGVIYLLSSNLYIEPDKLPADNIFDISFYWKEICDEWIKRNLYRRACISSFGNLLIAFKRSIHFINLLQCMSITIILKDIKQFIEESIKRCRKENSNEKMV